MSLDSIFNEESVTFGVVCDIILDSKVLDAMESDSSVVGVMD